MTDEEAATKLATRIQHWQSCVGRTSFSDVQPFPEAPVEVHAETALLPVAFSENCSTSVDGEAGTIGLLRETVAVEREHSRFLSDVIVREQALHAATLAVQARRQDRSHLIPNLEALHSVLATEAVQRQQRNRTRHLAVTMALLMLLALVAFGACWMVLGTPRHEARDTAAATMGGLSAGESRP